VRDVDRNLPSILAWRLLRAVIFDFDGTIVDSEPAIAAIYAEMAAMEGWCLSEEEYYRDFLALDDRGAIEHLYRSRGKELSAARRDEQFRWKTEAYFEAIRNGLPELPGAREFLVQCSARFPLAIASGSQRSEVEYLLNKLALRGRFSVVSTADDCSRSKPDPAVYLHALARLRELPKFRSDGLAASSCLAIEDAPGGIRAAKAAGLQCLALAHSRPPRELENADWVFSRFSEIRLEEIEQKFNER
jgi:beta-phosphoglucomutase